MNSVKDTITHIRLVQTYMFQIINDLSHRLLMHDYSKLEEPELSGYEGLSEAVAGLQYGSMAYRAAFMPYKAIIQHHYEHNDHHPEHAPNGINAMNLLQITEMLCDWRAASARNGGTLADSLEASIQRFGIGEQLAQIIRNTVRDMKW